MRYILFVLFLLTSFPAAAESGGEEELWNLLRGGGAIAMIRHADAPGVGDPPDFTLGDCATQRNLSEDGRAQARALGERFRSELVPVAAVLSSRWCRCLDTARLAFGDVTEFPPLDSFFGRSGAKTVQTEALKGHLMEWDGRDTLVMVTHQVNITALTGVFPRQGEIIVLLRDRDGIKVAGRIVASFDFARK